MTRLIIVEGLPGCGKSTMGKSIAGLLAKQGVRAEFTDEGTGSHPADYEFHAYISAENMKKFSFFERAQLKKLGEEHEGGRIIELSSLSGKLFDKALEYKIYDYLDWQTESPLMFERWEQFAKTADSDTVNIFNCCLIQNTMCETMVRFDYDAEVSLGHINGILSRVKELAPVVIYINEENFRFLIEAVADERGEDWLNGVVSYHTGGEYGRKHSLSGFDGYIECLEERRRRELEIVSRLDIPCLVLNDPSRDRAGAWQRVQDFILQYIDRR